MQKLSGRPTLLREARATSRVEDANLIRPGSGICSVTQSTLDYYVVGEHQAGSRQAFPRCNVRVCVVIPQGVCAPGPPPTVGYQAGTSLPPSDEGASVHPHPIAFLGPTSTGRKIPSGTRKSRGPVGSCEKPRVQQLTRLPASHRVSLSVVDHHVTQSHDACRCRCSPRPHALGTACTTAHTVRRRRGSPSRHGLPHLQVQSQGRCNCAPARLCL